MAHVYDTGLDKPQRTKIRDAIVAKLAPLKTTAVPALYISPNGIKTIARPLRGEGDDVGKDLIINALQGQSPSLGIALGRLAYEARGTSALESGGALDIAIYVYSRHERGVVDGRLYGDAGAAALNTNDPGIFTVQEHVRQLLLGQELGIAGVGPLRPVEEDEVATFDDFTIWEQRYSVEVDIEINPFRGVTQELVDIEGRHKLDPIPGGHAHDPLITTLAELEEP